MPSRFGRFLSFGNIGIPIGSYENYSFSARFRLARLQSAGRAETAVRCRNAYHHIPSGRYPFPLHSLFRPMSGGKRVHQASPGPTHQAVREVSRGTPPAPTCPHPHSQHAAQKQGTPIPGYRLQAGRVSGNCPDAEPCSLQRAIRYVPERPLYGMSLQWGQARVHQGTAERCRPRCPCFAALSFRMPSRHAALEWPQGPFVDLCLFTTAQDAMPHVTNRPARMYSMSSSAQDALDAYGMPPCGSQANGARPTGLSPPDPLIPTRPD